jgi:hypothetical protein
LNSTSVTADAERLPVAFHLTKWWGHILAAVYMIYGGVKIVLSILDRNYTDLWTPLLSVALGLVLLIFAYGYRDRKEFGWYGQVGLNGLVVLLSLFSLRQFGAVVILLLAAAALLLLFTPSTRSCFSTRR